MIHGDYHTKNLELTGDEVLLIDMDTLAMGHPIFELASMYNAFVGFGEYNREIITRFMGFDAGTAEEFWRRSLTTYLGTDDEARIHAVEDKARIIGYTRMIRRSIRRGGLEDEERRTEIEIWKGHLMELLEKTNALVFNDNEIEVEATRENLPKVMAFVDKYLEEADCSMKDQMQLDIAVEEIYVNIASYAYNPEIGLATVRVEVTDDPVSVSITFIDQGKPYDPLAKEDPDVTLPAEARGIGGLGIFMAKRSVDNIHYEYRDGKNVLTLEKKLT
jgi:anti-sigma regulatory factor (Ser/Thr protein kinase)